MVGPLVLVGGVVACGGVSRSSAKQQAEGGAASAHGADQAGSGGAHDGDARGGTDSGGKNAGGTAGDAGVSGSFAGSGGSEAEAAGAGQGGGAVIVEPSGLREGSFKMLVFSKTTAFRHDAAIAAGEEMLQKIAEEQGFEIVVTESTELFTLEGLAQFEIVFFNNTSGDVLTDPQQLAYEQWMTMSHGAFAGVHSAANTEFDWPFYAEVTGQFWDGGTAAGVADEIQFEPAAVQHPAVKGLPNPWQRADEWMQFEQHLEWTQKPGFQVLGRKASDGEPYTWVREWGNFRSFFSGLSHDGAAFGDPLFKRHIAGGIMWAVRREHLLKAP